MDYSKPSRDNVHGILDFVMHGIRFFGRARHVRLIFRRFVLVRQGGFTERNMDGAGDAFDYDFEDERPNLNRVAVKQLALADHQLAVYQRAVSTAEIANHGTQIGHVDEAMLSAHQIAVGADVAFGSAAKHE